MERLTKEIKKFNESVIPLAEGAKLSFLDENFQRVKRYLNDRDYLEEQIDRLKEEKNKIVIELEQKVNELYYCKCTDCLEINHVQIYELLNSIYENGGIRDDKELGKILFLLAHFSAAIGKSDLAVMYYNKYLAITGQPNINSFDPSQYGIYDYNGDGIMDD